MADEAVFPVWCYVDRLEQSGEITALEARRWKHELFSLMLERGLEPDGLVGIFEEPVILLLPPSLYILPPSDLPEIPCFLGRRNRQRVERGALCPVARSPF